MNRRTFTTMMAASAAATAVPTDALAAGADLAARGQRPRPYVVGHRGASGYRPEHTLASYTLAAQLGADFLEPDVVITKDRVLVCRHEPEIGGTTDVARRSEFADRKRTKILDGVPTTGWFVEDFTLAELRQLRAVERLPQVRQHNTVYDGLWQVPTLEEVFRLRATLSTQLGRPIGVYPETKHPTYFRTMGLPLEDKLLALMRKYDLDRPNAPIRVQSFELNNLVMMRRTLKARAPLVFLTSSTGGPFGDSRSYAQLLTPAGMATYASTINGIGPETKQVITIKGDSSTGQPTRLVADAHAANLEVCPYTVRAENQFLPVNLRTGSNPSDYGRMVDWAYELLNAGVDGIFTDNPDLGVLARDRYIASKN